MTIHVHHYQISVVLDTDFLSQYLEFACGYVDPSQSHSATRSRRQTEEIISFIIQGLNQGPRCN